MRALIANLSDRERRQVADWVGERPETVLVVAALRSGDGRAWIDGDPAAPLAALIESALVPGEPQGFGESEALLELLVEADGWGCVEVDDCLGSEIEQDFASRWGPAHSVIDVIHELRKPVAVYDQPLVRQLSPTEALTLPTTDADLLPDRRLVAAAAEHGRFFACVNDGVIVGHGGSLAAGQVFADVGVQVTNARRRQGMAIACASRACQALQHDGLIPVWGTSSENTASLAVAQKLGFTETARLTYLVRGDGEISSE